MIRGHLCGSVRGPAVDHDHLADLRQRMQGRLQIAAAVQDGDDDGKIGKWDRRGG